MWALGLGGNYGRPLSRQEVLGAINKVNKTACGVEVHHSISGGRCSSMSNKVADHTGCKAQTAYTYKGPSHGRRSKSVTQRAKDHTQNFSGFPSGYKRERSSQAPTSKSCWPSLPKGHKDVAASKAQMRGSAEEHLGSLQCPDLATMSFEVPPNTKYAPPENLRMIMLGEQDKTVSMTPPRHPGIVLPIALQSSQCMFGTATNKAGNPNALKTIARAVPAQAPKFMVHDAKSCSSSAYSNFSKTWVYNDDRRGARHWRSEYKGYKGSLSSSIPNNAMQGGLVMEATSIAMINRGKQESARAEPHYCRHCV